MSPSSRSFFLRTIQHVTLCLALTVLVACVRPVDTAHIPADPVAAESIWTRFINTSARTEAASGPFRLNATLYYSGKEDSQRVTAYLWGNGDTTEHLPLRLDILMGPGSVLAAIREDSQGIFIHVPREETVYHAADSNLLAIDVPVPFSLTDLAWIVTGRYANLFAPQDNDTKTLFHTAALHEDGSIEYTVPNAPLSGNVTIDVNGLPRAWTDGNGWMLDIEYWPDSTRPTPRKLSIKHTEGRQATLIVRTLDHPQPFAPKQLQLTVPPGTRLAPLEGKP